MIEIKKVTKTYNNKVKAIRDLSLDIPDGKIIGFSCRIYRGEDQAKYVNTKDTMIYVKGDS